jgi:hypothetical protein
MKRKAVLMSMAVVTSFPGWAMAKGGKYAEGSRAENGGAQKVEPIREYGVNDPQQDNRQADTSEDSPSSAWQFMERIKQALRFKTAAAEALAPELPTHRHGNTWSWRCCNPTTGRPTSTAIRVWNSRKCSE